MAIVNVRALPGRIAFSAPKGGFQISNDRFVPVTVTPWVNDLIHKHGDVEVEPDAARQPIFSQPRKAAPSGDKS
jgi:hypothetical protein